jgi:hypothetical protein
MSDNQTAPTGQHDAELTVLLESLDPCVGKHDRAIVGIQACITSGINKGPDIIATLKRLGLNGRHVGMLLHNLAGSDPSRHMWQREADGTYRSHGLAGGT